MAYGNHKIKLSFLRKGEEILHNCTSHWLFHLKAPLLYIISLLLPFIALFFLVSSGVLDNVQVVDQLWLAYGLYGLILTVYFFVKCVNFELGGVVITTQRVLCFGYIGLFQVVERDILPNKLEDVQILKRGFLSMFFDAADVHIHTSTGETEELDSVIDSKRIQSLLAELFRNATRPPEKSEKSDKVEKKKEGESGWIDEALGVPEVDPFDLTEHREEVMGDIGKLFRKKDS